MEIIFGPRLLVFTLVNWFGDGQGVGLMRLNMFVMLKTKRRAKSWLSRAEVMQNREIYQQSGSKPAHFFQGLHICFPPTPKMKYSSRSQLHHINET